jgi:predicted nucleic acid-binding protein
LRKLGLNVTRLLLSRFNVFEFDGFASDEAAKIYAELGKKGSEIPMRDAMKQDTDQECRARI